MIEFFGTSRDEEIRGTSTADKIRGGEGDDLIHAGDGADRVVAGPGDDIIDGDAAPQSNDLLTTAAGANIGDGPDTLIGGPGADTIDGDGGDDVIRPGAGPDRIEINPFDGTDRITDLAAEDLLIVHRSEEDGLVPVSAAIQQWTVAYERSDGIGTLEAWPNAPSLVRGATVELGNAPAPEDIGLQLAPWGEPATSATFGPQALYIGLFDRVPSATARTFWQEEMDALTSEGASERDAAKDIASRLLDSPEAASSFDALGRDDPTTEEVADLVDDLYAHLFERAPTEAAREHWTERFEVSLNGPDDPGAAVVDLIAGSAPAGRIDLDDDGQAEPAFDQAVLTNKLAIGQYSLDSASGEALTEAMQQTDHRLDSLLAAREILPAPGFGPGAEETGTQAVDPMTPGG